jgi:hypothetical protein
MRLVAGLDVGVPLGPVLRRDAGDPSFSGQFERPAAGQEVVDGGEVTIWAVGVRALLDGPSSGGLDALAGEAAHGVIGVLDGERGTDAARHLPTGSVELGVDLVPRGVQARGGIGPVGPGADRSGGRGAADATADFVVGVGEGPAVDRLLEHPAGDVAEVRQLGVGTADAGQMAVGVVGEAGDRTVGVLQDEPSVGVPLVTDGLARLVGP